MDFSRPPNIISGLIVAILALAGAVLVATPLCYMAGKSEGWMQPVAVLGVGVLVSLVALVWALALRRRASKGWRVVIIVYLVVAGFASLGPGIEMLKRSDLERCPSGFIACIWSDTKDLARELKDEI